MVLISENKIILKMIVSGDKLFPNFRLSSTKGKYLASDWGTNGVNRGRKLDDSL